MSYCLFFQLHSFAFTHIKTDLLWKIIAFSVISAVRKKEKENIQKLRK